MAARALELAAPLLRLGSTFSRGLTWFINNAPNRAVESVSDNGAHVPMSCGHCGRDVSAAVLVMDLSPQSGALWLRCPNCRRGSVANGGKGIQPAARPGSDLRGLPEDVARAYNEARDAASVHAWTAAEMMCRKILMHVAVDKGAKEGQTFAHYIDHLANEGYVPVVMKSWVDLLHLYRAARALDVREGGTRGSVYEAG